MSIQKDIQTDRIKTDRQTDRRKDEIDKRKKDSHTNRQILTKERKKKSRI